MHILIVTGSRNCTDTKFVLDKLSKHSYDRLLVGDCPTGVDKIVRENYTDAKVFVADWNKYGLSAGPVRNSMMIREFVMSEDPTTTAECVAFWNGKIKNSGTLNCIELARQANIPTTIYMV